MYQRKFFNSKPTKEINEVERKELKIDKNDFCCSWCLVSSNP